MRTTKSEKEKTQEDEEQQGQRSEEDKNQEDEVQQVRVDEKQQHSKKMRSSGEDVEEQFQERQRRELELVGETATGAETG